MPADGGKFPIMAVTKGNRCRLTSGRRVEEFAAPTNQPEISLGIVYAAFGGRTIQPTISPPTLPSTSVRMNHPSANSA